MKAVVLAAGYATRLYPLTKTQPKPLLEVGGAAIIDRLLEQLRALPLSSMTVVSNAKFGQAFAKWCPDDVTLITNSSVCAEDRLGAVGDLKLALGTAEPLEPVLIAAADNLFDDGFADLVAHSRETEASTIAVWRNDDPVDRTQRGNVDFDAQGIVTRFVEKPAVAPSPWSAAPVYVLRATDVPRVDDYLAAGHNPDAPGHLWQWLCKQTRVSAYRMPRSPKDIGTLPALEAARAAYGC